MKRITLFAVLTVTAAVAWAVSPGVSLALSSASRGHVSSQAQVADARTGLCFWQVPGKSQWVNLAAVQTFSVVLRRDGYMTSFRYGVGNWDEIPVPKGVPINTHVLQVLERIKECQQ